MPCRGCFVACAFLCVLSCARRAGGARGLLVTCWICAKKFALRGDSDREARKSSPCSAKIAGFRCFWACWASFFAVWPRWRCCWANFFAVWAGWDNAGGFMCACRAGGARGLLVACWGSAKKFALRGDSDREARKSSPCGVIRIGKREKVRPARQKWSVFGVFELAGRVFSRFGLDGGVVGRTFSRREATGALLGELFRAATTPATPAISR